LHSPAKAVAQVGTVAALMGYLVRGRRRPGEVTVISHSDLFYWWPVWLVGFLMAAITYFQGVHAGFIHGQPKVVKMQKDVGYTVVDDPNERPGQLDKDDQAIITSKKDQGHNPFPLSHHAGEDKHFFPYMSPHKSLGVIFGITVFLVILITNVHLRGLWSVVVIVIVVLGSIIFALAGWWEIIIAGGGQLAIHINMGFYLAFSLLLFVAWVINFGFFDRQRYVAVTSRQVRLKLAIGEGEIVYDATGMVFQKQRSDLFRHWILGFGSGDLVIRPSGKDLIDLPNVLFVGSKVREIEELIRAQQVTPAH
jgi:hypothetical protein